jgi:transcriptional regulator with XRE-family HTH domain
VKKKTPRRYYKDEELLTKIGNKIREVRLSKNISQESLANEIEVDYSQVNRMELGKVNFNISNLYRIAKALNADPKRLLP